MSATEVRQGNMFKLVVALTENGAAYGDFSTADVVRGKLTSRNKATTLSIDDTDANFTIDDPSDGSVSWQLTSEQTALLTLGVYSLAIQVEFGGNTNIIEWVDPACIEIVGQDI